jgi:hypothetical protein
MISDLHTTIGPGDQLAVCMPGLAMLVGIGPSGRDGTTRLMQQVRAAAGSGGRALARSLAGALATDVDLPPFALVADGDPGLVVLVHGAMRATFEGPAPLTISGRDVATWVDRVVDDPVRALVLLPDDGTSLDWAPPTPYELVAGAVPANALRIAAAHRDPDDPPTATAADAAADPAPLPPSAFPGGRIETIDGTDIVDVRPPLPISTGAAPPIEEVKSGAELVEGVLCSREHLSSPSSAYCGVCGIAMVHRTHNVVVGPRPPLGVLVFDDGTTYTLDAGYVIGREPEDDPRVMAGRARPLVLDDPDRGVSRHHAEVVLDGWDVLIVDRGSTNGTFVYDDVSERWERLARDVPFALAPSMRVALGKRTFVFETPHQAPGQGRHIAAAVRGGR